MIVLMIIRMLIIHLRVIQLLLGCSIRINWGRILLIVIVVSAIVRVRAWILNWCWRLIKAIEVSFIIIICVIVHRVCLWMLLIRIVVPFGWLRLMVHWLHMMMLLLLLVVVPRCCSWLLILKEESFS